MLPDWISPGKVPDLIGPFRIVRLLGEGGSGAVFLAERTEQFTQQVAIKILRPRLSPYSNDSAVSQEGEILASLDHPGIVRLLDSGETSEGLSYLVMQYIDGEPVDVYCDTLCVSLPRRIELLLEIFDIVEYAHRRLVIHSDLKPANMLVGADGTVSLLDFGIATLHSDLPQDSAPGFSKHFASPEQLAGERLTLATDIYSLGAIAHSVLTGLFPRAITSDSLHSTSPGSSTALPASELAAMNPVLLHSVAKCRKESPRSFLAAMRGDLEAILDKALRIHPAERFESVQQMSDEFRRYAKGHPLRIQPAGWFVHTQKWVLRNRAIASLAIALVVVVVLSILGITAQTAKASRKRQIAMERLHELAHLTDTLAGELYDSVHGLPGSQSVQADLLRNAHAAMEKLASEEFQDPQLDIEIAAEYEKLAALEMNNTAQRPEVRRQAIQDLNEAIRLLSLLPSNEPQFARARQRLPVIVALRDSTATSQ